MTGGEGEGKAEVGSGGDGGAGASSLEKGTEPTLTQGSDSSGSTTAVETEAEG